MVAVTDEDVLAEPVSSPQRPRFVASTRRRLRETLLDAAGEVLRERGGWRDTRMADVAGRAGVSRQTLYQHFGSREALVEAVLLRDADRFLNDVERAVVEHRDDAQAATAAAFDVFLDAVADDLLVKASVQHGGGDALAILLHTHGASLLHAARERLEALFCQTWPGVSEADARLVAEAVVRLATSFLTLPVVAPQLTGQAVARMLGPFVRQCTGTDPYNALAQ